MGAHLAGCTSIHPGAHQGQCSKVPCAHCAKNEENVSVCGCVWVCVCACVCMHAQGVVGEEVLDQALMLEKGEDERREGRAGGGDP